MYTNHFFKLLAKLNHSSLIEILDTPDDLKISRLIKKKNSNKMEEQEGNKGRQIERQTDIQKYRNTERNTER